MKHSRQIRFASTMLLIGLLFSLLGLLNAQIAPSPTGSWKLTGAMSQARTGAAAAALNSGSVLVTGGTDASGEVSASAELYGSNGTFIVVAPMHVARTGHTATWLANPNGSGGFVLVTGGTSSSGAMLASAELYDPLANTWTLLASPMIDSATGQAAAPLPNSSLLLSGGSNSSGPLTDVESFSLASQQFSFVGPLATARKNHAAAALLSGSVLIVGGTDASGNTLASTAIYNPVAGTVSAGPSLSTPRANTTATTLLDGTVLIAGGSYPEGAAANGNIAELNTAEIYNPATNTIAPASAKLVQARAGQQAFLLPNNGNVLLVGGTYNGATLASSELYTPWLSQFAATGSLSVPRSSASGAALFPLADGQLLVAGGTNQQPDVSPTVANSAELYGFATLETNATDYAPGTAVLMTGTGWKPSENVTITLNEVPAVEPIPILTTTADVNGKIDDGAYAPDKLDLGIRYYATAVGATSGLQAQNTFTDSNTFTFTSSAFTVATSTCSTAITVAPNYSMSGGDYINLTSSSSGGVFYSNSGCTTALSTNGGHWYESCSAASGVNCTSFYYKDSTAGTPTLTVADYAHTTYTGTQVETIGGTPTLTGISPSTAVYGAAAISTFTATGTNFVSGTSVINFNGADLTTTCSSSTTCTASITAAELKVNVGNLPVYVHNSSTDTTSQNFSLTQKPITVTAITNSKAYDGTTTAAATPTNTGVATGDTAAFVEAYASKNAGTGNLTLTPSGVVTDGNSGNNYSYTYTSVSTGTITKKAITATAVTNSKAYDGTTSAAATPTNSGVASGDTAAFIEAYASKNVGTGNLTLTPSGVVTDGNSGNNYSYTYTSVSTGTITAKAITVTAVTNSKAYDGTTTAAATPNNSGVASGDTAAFIEAYASKNVGTGNLTLTPSGVVTDGNSGNNYSYTYTSVSTGTITKKAITATAVTNSKAYDGTTSAAATPTNSGVASGDTAAFIEAYASKNVGTGNLTLTPSGVVTDGNSGNNYSYTYTSVSTGTITKKAITATAVTNSKAYDGTTSAAATPTNSGVASGDTAAFIEAYASKNVGTGNLTLTPSGVVTDGNSGNNYSYTYTSVSTGTITAKAITVTAVTNSKAYDGTTSAAATPTNSGVASGDTAAFIEAYASKNVGTGNLTLTPSGVVTDGNSGNNYSYTYNSVSTGTITKKAITATAVTNSKAYDGTTSAAATPTNSGVASGDTAAFIEAYASKNVGTGNLTLTPSGVVTDGNSGNNYSYTYTSVSTGTITAKAITVTAVTNSKAYDGTTTAAATPNSSGVASGDTAAFIEAYASKNVGTGNLTLTPSGVVTDGNSGNNYSYTYTSVSTGTITSRAITVTAASNSKPYDGTTTAAALPTITTGSLASGDTVTWSETYASKNVGTSLTLTPAGTVSDGNSGLNYNVTFTPANTGTITARAITVTAASNSKPYDGATSAAAVPTITSGTVVSGDTANFTESYGTKNVGINLTLTPVGSVSDGNTGLNYNVTLTPANTGTITALPITVTAAANSKPYDGTMSAAAVPTITGGTLVTGDIANFTESYGTKNAGINLTLTPVGSVSDGNAGLNYSVTLTPANTGTITALPITVTAAANSKAYDGTMSAAAVPTITGGTLVTGDIANFTESYGTKNAGINLTLTPVGSVSDGNAGLNYSVTLTPANTGTITARAITVTAASNSKPYDGTTSAAAVPTITSGTVVTGDTANFTESYGTKNAGINLTLTPVGSVSDGNTGLNYSVTLTPANTGTITALPITVTAAANSKAYDGTMSAAAVPTITGGTLVTGDIANFTESYGTKNAGINLTLTPVGSVSDGNAGLNYSVTLTPANTGTITARAITVTAASNSKPYDGTTSAAAVPTITSGTLIAPDSAVWSEAYASASAGTGLTLIPAGTVSDSNGGLNYNVTFANSTSGAISALTVSASVVANNKPYDGTTTDTLASCTVNGVLAGDSGSVTCSSSNVNFATSGVGNGIAVTASGITLGGLKSGDYILSSTTATTAANITQGTQTISFPNPGPQVYAPGAAGTFLVSASSSNAASLPTGLTVSFKGSFPGNAAICSLYDNLNGTATVTLLGSGTCILEAMQSGSPTYAAAASVSLQFTVSHASQSISFSPLTSPEPIGTPQTLMATSVTGLSATPTGVPVTYTSLTTGICTLDVTGTIVTGNAAGLCTVQASAAATAQYTAATTVKQSFTVGKDTQTISFPNPGPQVYAPGAAGTFQVSASSLNAANLSTGLTVSFIGSFPGNANICSLVDGGNGTATVTLLGAGTCTLEATQSGNATYLPATSISLQFTVSHASQSILFSSLTNPTPIGTPQTLMATSVTGLLATPTGVPVTFTSLTTGICTLDVTGTIVTGNNPGLCTVQASAAGTAQYIAATSVKQSFTVGKYAQTINFPNPGPQVYAPAPGGTFQVSASSLTTTNSPTGLTVSFIGSFPGNANVCSLVDSGLGTATVTLLGAGTCTLEATQGGNGTYAAATSVSLQFTVSHASQTITSFSSLTTEPIGTPQNLTATSVTGGSATPTGLPVTFTSLTTGVCTLDVTGTIVTGNAAGLCNVQASAAGTAQYAAASPVSQSFMVTKDSQTIQFASLPTPVLGGTVVPLSATSVTGLSATPTLLPVTFTSLTPTICTITGSGTSVTANVAGLCTVQASQSGNTQYGPASSVSQSLTVYQNTQTISFPNPGPQVYALGAAFQVSASSLTAASLPTGLTVSFKGSFPGNANVCSLVDNLNGTATVTLLGAGTCTLQAMQGGSPAYSAATSVSLQFAVSHASQTISFSALSTEPIGTPQTLTAISVTGPLATPTGLPVTFTSLTTSICTLDVTGTIVTGNAVGLCNVQAKAAGTAQYAAAPPASQSFRVTAQ